MSNSTRIGVCLVVIVAALMFAVWPRAVDPGGSDAAEQQSAPDPSAQPTVSAGDLVGARAAARLPPCPAARPAVSTASRLTNDVLDCLGGGPAVDVAQASGGRPIIVNYWAFWCAPCRHELPVLADFAVRAGQRVQLLAMQGVDGAQRPDLSLNLLGDIGVRLPTFVDTQGRFAAAAGLPRVYPTTVLIRPDGTVAAVMPKVFRSTDEIAQAVEQYLDVTV